MTKSIFQRKKIRNKKHLFHIIIVGISSCNNLCQDIGRVWPLVFIESAMLSQNFSHPIYGLVFISVALGCLIFLTPLDIWPQPTGLSAISTKNIYSQYQSVQLNDELEHSSFGDKLNDHKENKGIDYVGDSFTKLRLSDYPTQSTTIGPEVMDLFKPLLNEEELERYRKTIRSCVKAVDAAGIFHFLYSGSLIGWFRHNHSMIPWDDDVDIAMIPNDMENKYSITYYRNLLKTAASSETFIEQNGRLGFATQRGVKLKCYSLEPDVSETISSSFQWRWPFIDIHLMRVYLNGTEEPVYEFSKIPPSVQRQLIIEDPMDNSFRVCFRLN